MVENAIWFSGSSKMNPIKCQLINKQVNCIDFKINTFIFARERIINKCQVFMINIVESKACPVFYSDSICSIFSNLLLIWGQLLNIIIKYVATTILLNIHTDIDKSCHVIFNGCEILFNVFRGKVCFNFV